MTDNFSQLPDASASLVQPFEGARAFEDLPYPVFVWDSDLGGFVWANAAGLERWGALSLASFRASRLDRAMPAMLKLKDLCAAALPVEGVTQTLTFWTPRGAARMACRCRPIDLGDDGHGLVIEAADENSGLVECRGRAPAPVRLRPAARTAHAPNDRGQDRIRTMLPSTTPKRVAGFLNGEGGGDTTAATTAEPNMPAPTPDDHLAMQEIARMLGRPSTKDREDLSLPTTSHLNGLEAGTSGIVPPVGAELRKVTEVLAKRTSTAVEQTLTVETSIEPNTPSSDTAGMQFDTLNHELRTPLNSIIGFAEMMHREQLGPIGNDRYKEYAGDILDSARHALNLINDLLDASRVRAGHLDVVPEEINVPELLDRVVALTAPQAQAASVKVVCGYPDRMPPLHADTRALRQILLNILTNAFKFTPAGGHVFVSARQSNTEFIIDIRDTGIGMTDEQIADAMKLWVRNNGSGHPPSAPAGSGLGLPLVKALTEAMAGELEITSAPGEGTCVTVRLPAEPNLAVTGT